MVSMDTLEDYEVAGFGQQIGFGHSPALVVIDMVRAYFDPTSPISSPLYEGVDEACLNAVDAARGSGIPVIFTNVKYHANGLDGGFFYRKIPSLRLMNEGSPYGEFTEILRPSDGDLVVTKQYASAFFGTSLSSTLASLNVDTLLICGVSTSGCVRATATDATQHGFRSIVIREAVGDRDPSINQANLFDLNAKYADVVGLADVLDYLEKIRS